MTEKTSLLPCLSCGSDTSLSIRPEESEGVVFTYYVGCGTCGARGRNRTRIGWCESETEAAEAWNDRTVALSEKALFDNRFTNGYSIAPHGQPGEFALYAGRSAFAHGLRLCQLSDFDRNGEKLRHDIVRALNQYRG